MRVLMSVLSEFQFQYGAIERDVSLKLTRQPFFDFNSSMVRLREEMALFIRPVLIDFNSSMVRLRA